MTGFPVSAPTRFSKMSDFECHCLAFETDGMHRHGVVAVENALLCFQLVIPLVFVSGGSRTVSALSQEVDTITRSSKQNFPNLPGPAGGSFPADFCGLNLYPPL